jgi:hypothetical protein
VNEERKAAEAAAGVAAASMGDGGYLEALEDAAAPQIEEELDLEPALELQDVAPAAAPAPHTMWVTAAWTAGRAPGRAA